MITAFVLLAHFQFFELKSQHIIWAKKNNLDKKSSFTKVVGQNKNGVYVLKHKSNVIKKSFIIEHFDKNLSLIKNVVIKIPNAQLEKIMISKNQILYVTKRFEKNGDYSVLMNGLDSNFNLAISNVLYTVNTNSKYSNIKIFNHLIENTQMVMVFESNNQQTDINYFYFKEGQLVKKNKISINQEFKNIYIGQGLINNIGNIFMVYTYSEDFKSTKSDDFKHRILSIDIQANVFKEQLINNSRTYISNCHLVSNDSMNQVSVVGFFGETNDEENKGYLVIKQNGLNLNLISTDFIHFNKNIIENIVGRKAEQKGEQISRFYIRKVIPKQDGGLIIVGEKFYTTTQNEVFYINGIPQSTYAKIYNYEEVLVLNLNNQSQVNWFDILHKTQSSVNDGGIYNGIIIVVNDNDFSFLYNDRLSANSDIIQVKYDDFGLQNKKILLRNDQFYALILPNESKQVNGNSLVIPIIQNRENTYIKLIY